MKEKLSLEAILGQLSADLKSAVRMISENDHYIPDELYTKIINLDYHVHNELKDENNKRKSNYPCPPG